MKILDWMQHSGSSVTIIVNPCHWRLVPWYERDDDIMISPQYRSVCVGWLFIVVKLWIDDTTW